MTDNLDSHLTRAWHARWNQDQVLWRIFGSFWPTNAILLAALFRSGVPRNLTIITCSAGLFVAIVWFFIQRRAIVNLTRLEMTAAKLEKVVLNSDAAKYGLSPDVNEEDTKKAPIFTARRVMYYCVILVGLAWLTFLVLALFH